jgi:transposase
MPQNSGAKARSAQEELRLRAKTLLDAHVPVVTVVQQTNLSRSTVQRLKAGSTVVRKVGSGRPSVLKAAHKIAITKTMKGKLGASVRKMAVALRIRGVDVSKSSIQRYVVQQPWGKAYKPQKVPMLSQRNKADRLDFASGLLKGGWRRSAWGTNRMKYLIFTDESSIHFFDDMNRQNVRFRTEHRCDVPPAVQVHSKGGSIMIAGGLTDRGLTRLHFIPDGQTVDQQYYTQEILPFYKQEVIRLYGDEFNKVKLQEDGARPHVALTARAWVQANWPADVLFPRGEGKFFWPGNSPDLNPIEHIWAELKRRILLRPTASNKDELRQLVASVWDDLDSEHFGKSLVHSFIGRLEKVIEAKGECIGRL